MTAQTDVIARLDAYFNIQAFDESADRKFFPPGYGSVLEHYTAAGFLQSGWNGLMLDNAKAVDRVYLSVFPSPSILDTIIAREVQRGAPGALLFSHHLADYQENGPSFSPIAEAQLEELQEHKISLYVCHAPLDCHPETSTSTALANALKVRDPERFAPRYGGLAGVHGKIGPIGFHELAKRAAEVTGLPSLRYSAVRNNGRTVQHVALIAGAGGDPADIQAAIDVGADTYITGEWWPSGPGETRTAFRNVIHELLLTADINLIGTSRYSSDSVVMRDQMPGWFRANVAGVETQFVAPDDPFR